MERTPLNTIYRFASIAPLGELEFEGVAATPGLKDDGYALDIAGGDISRFRDGKGPLLLSHDRNTIVGTASLRKTGSALLLRGKFCSPGVSATADEARSLLKDGALNGISLGFAVKESERLGKSPRDGIRATRWEAIECSLVACGLDPDAVVTQRELSRLLGRSGRRLSAETERCLRAALAHHESGTRSHRDAANMLEQLLLRDDDMGADDEGERARLRLRLAILRRKGDPGLSRLAAVQKLRDRSERQRALARLRAMGARY